MAVVGKNFTILESGHLRRSGFLTLLVRVELHVLDVFFFQAEDGIRDKLVTGVQTCALPIWRRTVPKRWCRRPQRMSPSTRTVRNPASANANARCDERNDFPSPLPGLETAKASGA